MRLIYSSLDLALEVHRHDEDARLAQGREGRGEDVVRRDPLRRARLGLGLGLGSIELGIVHEEAVRLGVLAERDLAEPIESVGAAIEVRVVRHPHELFRLLRKLLLAPRIHRDDRAVGGEHVQDLVIGASIADRV